jgi:hypothetical protein
MDVVIFSHCLTILLKLTHNTVPHHLPMADETQRLDDDRLLSGGTPFSSAATPSSGGGKIRGPSISGGIIGGATATLRSMMLRSGANSRGFVPPSTAGDASGRPISLAAAPQASRGSIPRMSRDDDADAALDDEFSVELKALGEDAAAPHTVHQVGGYHQVNLDEGEEGRTTARLSSRIATPCDGEEQERDAQPIAPSAECTHHTATSHISATQDDNEDDDDDVMVETMDGARPTHHYAVGDDGPLSSMALERETPSSPHAPPDVILVVAASLPNSLPIGSSSDATTTSSGPNGLPHAPPPSLPPTSDTSHHDDHHHTLCPEEVPLFPGAQHRRPKALPNTQLTHGGTLLIQDLSPRDFDTSVAPEISVGSTTAAAVQTVLGGIGSPTSFQEPHAHSDAALHQEQRDVLPDTLDDGMPCLANIALAFSDSDMHEEERQGSPLAGQLAPGDKIDVPLHRHNANDVSQFPCDTDGADEREVELIASDDEDGRSASTTTYTNSDDLSSDGAEEATAQREEEATAQREEEATAQREEVVAAPSVMAADSLNVQPLNVELPPTAATKESSRKEEEEDAPLFKQHERIASAPSLSANHSKQKRLSSEHPSSSSKQDALGYSSGDLVEARWGASWYPARVVSILGKAVEVRWLKDNSTVHMTLKHVRRPKASKTALPQHTDANHNTTLPSVDNEDNGTTPKPRAPRSSIRDLDATAAGKDSIEAATTLRVSPPPRCSTSSKGFHTSTQLVRLMEEEDELEQRQKKQNIHDSSRKATRMSSKPLGGSDDHDDGSVTPSVVQQRTSKDLPAGHISGATTESRHDPSHTGSTTAPPRGRRPRSDSPIERGGDHDATQPQHSSAMDDDFGDSSTPPSALLYFSPAALAELPPETRSRCKRDIPRVMIVSSLRDVVSWAMNSNFQTNVPFVMLLSRSKLESAAGSASQEEDAQDNSVAYERQALIIATALGVTALDYHWISQSLHSLSRGGTGGGGVSVAHEPYALRPELALPAPHPQSQRELPPSTRASCIVRLFPIPKALRAFFNDVVWCPGKDTVAEMIIQAAGGRVVRDVRETITIINDFEVKQQRNLPSSTSSLPEGGAPSTSSSSLAVSSIALYVPPGGRVGSALRDPRLAALLQLDYVELQEKVVSHYQSSVCTRPVSYATAGGIVSSTPSPATANRTSSRGQPVGAAQPQLGGGMRPEHHPLNATEANRFLSMEDSQQAIPPLHHPATVAQQQHHRTEVITGNSSGVGDRNAAARPMEQTPVMLSAATPAATPLPHLPPAALGIQRQGMHSPTFQRPLPLQDIASYSQPVSVTGRTLRSATGGNAFRHRRWAHEQAMASQPPIPPQHPFSSKLVGPLPVQEDDELMGGQSNSTTGHVSITIGDDFYFYMAPHPVEGDDGGGANNTDDATTVGIGRVSAIAEDGEHVIMRLYQITGVTIHRRNATGPSKRARDDDTVGLLPQTRGAAGRSMQRITTMALTDEYATVSPRMLDVHTPLFVVDEHLQDHLYILERPRKLATPPRQPPPPVVYEQSMLGVVQSVPEVIPLRVHGVRKYVEVGTKIGFRPSPGTVDGSLEHLRGTVRSFQRDSAVPAGLFIVVEIDVRSRAADDEADDESAQGVPLNVQPQRAVITSDMITDVFASPVV